MRWPQTTTERMRQAQSLLLSGPSAHYACASLRGACALDFPHGNLRGSQQRAGRRIVQCTGFPSVSSSRLGQPMEHLAQVVPPASSPSSINKLMIRFEPWPLITPFSTETL